MLVASGCVVCLLLGGDGKVVAMVNASCEWVVVVKLRLRKVAVLSGGRTMTNI